MQRRRFLKTAAGIFVPAACGIVRAQPFQLNDPALLATTRPKAAGGFVYHATGFSSASVKKTANLTGIADATAFAVSFWVKITGGDGTERYFFSAFNGSSRKFYMYITSGNVMSMVCRNTGSTQTVVANANVSITTASGWINCLCSFDLTNNLSKWYFNETDVLTLVSMSVGDSVNFNMTGSPVWAFGDVESPFEPITAYISEVWFGRSYIDFSVQSNRYKFHSPTGHPVDLGADGSTPTGTAADIYFHSNYAAFTTNSGSGGNFAAGYGTLTDQDANKP